LELQSEIVERLKRLGFSEVVVDPNGYRSGSLNEAIKHAIA